SYEYDRIMNFMQSQAESGIYYGYDHHIRSKESIETIQKFFNEKIVAPLQKEITAEIGHREKQSAFARRRESQISKEAFAEAVTNRRVHFEENLPIVSLPTRRPAKPLIARSWTVISEGRVKGAKTTLGQRVFKVIPKIIQNIFTRIGNFFKGVARVISFGQ